MGDCRRLNLRGVRGVEEEICTGDAKKASWGPGWGCLCGCATCIECCDGCPRVLVLLTVLSSCWKDGTSKGPGCWVSSWYWACRAAAWMGSRLRPRRSKLMPVRCDRRWILAGDGRTVAASNTVGVECCRRCWMRGRWMPAGIFVDSISNAGRVRSRFSRRGEVLWGPKLNGGVSSHISRARIAYKHTSRSASGAPPGGRCPYEILSTDAVSQ